MATSYVKLQGHAAKKIVLFNPNCFSRSYVKFKGHTALKIVEFDTDWAFPDCNSSFNSLMDMKLYTKLDV